MTRRLTEAMIDALPPAVSSFAYDRAAVRRGVVHLGLGAFHRAHQAMVFDEALRQGDARWGIVGVSMRSTAVRDRLKPQDGLYSVTVRDGVEEATRVVGALLDVLVAPEQPAAVVEAIAHPDTHLVTLTVTEKGYNLDPATGVLDLSHPDVRYDMTGSGGPRTVQRFLVDGLALRRARGLSPLTILSCDNLPGNGARLQASMLAMAAALDSGLARWIEGECRFPNSMVDRIVPAAAADDAAKLERRVGYRDEAGVGTEAFWQWVIEDRFAGARPELAALGVHLVADVRAWEAAKLRLLNGAHSAMAYLGGLAGLDYVHEFVALPEGRRFIETLWAETAPTLAENDGVDIAGYCGQLMERFGNVSLRHRLHQIAADGSQKLPQRLITTYAVRRRAGLASDAIGLAIAGWMRWQAGVDDLGRPHLIDDPLSQPIANALEGQSDAAARVDVLLSLDTIFPIALAADAAVRLSLATALHSLETQGARAALADRKQAIL